MAEIGNADALLAQLVEDEREPIVAWSSHTGTAMLEAWEHGGQGHRRVWRGGTIAEAALAALADEEQS